MREHSLITFYSISHDVRSDFPMMVHLDEVRYDQIPLGVNFDQ